MGNDHTRERARQRARRDTERIPEEARAIILRELTIWDAGRGYLAAPDAKQLVGDDIHRAWSATTGGTPNGLRGFVDRWLADFCGHLDYGTPEQRAELRQLWETHLAVLDATRPPVGRPPVGKPIHIRLEPGLLAAVDEAAKGAGVTRPMMIRRIIAQHFDVPD